MRNLLFILLAASCLFEITACRKHAPAQPAQPNQPVQPVDSNNVTPKVSDSKYNNATFDLLRQREILRYDTGPDTVKEGMYSWAQFSDSANPSYYQYTVGRVLLSGIDFGNPIFRGGGQWQYYGAFDMNSEPHLLDSPRFVVMSTNGITDLNYVTNNQFYYQDTLPRVIKRSQGLTIKVDPTVAPNTDSVRMTIEGNATTISTTVSVMAGSASFSSTQLAGLVPDNTWRTTIVIRLADDHQMTNNGRAFFVGISRAVVWHVNVE